MPIVNAKRKRQIEEELVQKAKRCKLNHHEMFSKIGYTNDHHHSLYREIPLIGVNFEKIVRREVGSFLNGNGGIIAFGVRTNGTILGNKMTRKEEDNFKLAVDRIMIGFHPIVKPAMYRLIVEPVYDKYNPWVGCGLFLIQLKVNKGETYSLYEDGEHEVYVRYGNSSKGPLTAREIKERVMAEYEQRCRKNKGKEIESKANKENETVNKMGKVQATTTISIKVGPKTSDAVRERKEGGGKKEADMKTSKENSTATGKAIQKTTNTVIREETKVITKPEASNIIKIRKPMTTKN